MSSKNAVVIDARAAAYAGDPIRVLAVTDTASGKILIKKTAQWREPVKVKDNTTVVTDTPSIFNHWGLAFNEKEQMDQVLMAYKEAQRANMLSISDDLRRYEPSNVIQMRKFDERGAALEFDSSTLNNGHMAILLAIWAARKAHGGYIINQQPQTYNANNEDEKDIAFDDAMMPFSI
ncbi:hypothetical protein [Psychrobacter sp. I-STPA10]|uniref:hypothetical protein n=1 Tax=Psychrobacter sp. I-STPA10 TaxID=2585769 RepID=UPI001E5A04FD|nr:hypothetical protein [Psychrobacter sp. I-STPA10]